MIGVKSGRPCNRPESGHGKSFSKDVRGRARRRL